MHTLVPLVALVHTLVPLVHTHHRRTKHLKYQDLHTIRHRQRTKLSRTVVAITLVILVTVVFLQVTVLVHLHTRIQRLFRTLVVALLSPQSFLWEVLTSA